MTKFEIKIEHKLKHQNNDLIKPVLFVSGIKLLNFIYKYFARQDYRYLY